VVAAEAHEPLVSVQEFAAQALGLKVGSVVEWTATDGNVRARVAIFAGRMRQWGPTINSFCRPVPSTQLSAVFYGAMRVKPERIEPFKRGFRAFPTVTVTADILEVSVSRIDEFAVCGLLRVCNLRRSGGPGVLCCRNALPADA
jgi:predicted lysophospholipase L1 biosynthesis ABC-type transport system permease subunit